jgi:lipopolysaccharide export system permease protein
VKILTKYVLKEHVGPFVFASTALTSLMLLQYIGKRLGDLVGKGLPWHVLIEFFVLSMPFTVAMTLPMAVLVALLYAYSRMASENEITAMRANGIGMRTLMVPTFIAGAGVALVMLVFNDQVLSRANHQLAVLQNDITRTKPSFALKEQIINTVADQKLYLRASRIDRGSQHMRGVVIYDVSNPQHRRTIYADSGTLAFAENRTDLLLHLYDGWMLEVPTEHPDQMTRVFFRSDLLRVRNVTNTFEASDADSAMKTDREMTVCEMQKRFADADFQWQQAQYDREMAQVQLRHVQGEKDAPWPAKPVRRDPAGLGRIYCAIVDRLVGVKEASAATLPFDPQGPPRVEFQQVPGRAGRVQGPPRAGSTRAGQETTHVHAEPPGILRHAPSSGFPSEQGPLETNEIQLRNQIQSAVSREQSTRYLRTRYDIEIQKKFSLAAACLIFVLLGPPIAVRFPRGGVGLVIGVSFVVFALYYVGLIGGEALADNEYISPFWAMWGANIILLAVGTVMTLRMNRVSGATRGGDWSEIREAMRHGVRRLFRREPRGAT